MKTYVFRVVVEPDEDGWHAYCPVLEEFGAATWGKTQEDALKDIQEVLVMILEEFRDEGRSIPAAEQMTEAEGALEWSTYEGD